MEMVGEVWECKLCSIDGIGSICCSSEPCKDMMGRRHTNTNSGHRMQLVRCKQLGSQIRALSKSNLKRSVYKSKHISLKDNGYATRRIFEVGGGAAVEAGLMHVIKHQTKKEIEKKIASELAKKITEDMTKEVIKQVEIQVTKDVTETLVKQSTKTMIKSVAYVQAGVTFLELCNLGRRCYNGEVTTTKEITKEATKIIADNGIQLACTVAGTAIGGPIGGIIGSLLGGLLGYGLKKGLDYMVPLDDGVSKKQELREAAIALGYYEGLDALKGENFNRNVLKRRYHDRTKNCHPDREGGDHGEFVALTARYYELQGMLDRKEKLGENGFDKLIDQMKNIPKRNKKNN